MQGHAAIATCLLMTSAALAPAEARPGCIHQDAYLFTSPGYLGGLIGTIPAPAPVEVVRRGAKWSIVSFYGQTGYVTTRHLVANSGARPDPPPIVYDQSIGAPKGPVWTGPFYALNGQSRRSRSYWTRDSTLSPDDPAWAACGLSRGPSD